MPVRFESFVNGLGDTASDQIRFAKADFALGWMDIHVDCFRIHFQKKEGHRVLTLHQGSMIAFPQAHVGW